MRLPLALVAILLVLVGGIVLGCGEDAPLGPAGRSLGLAGKPGPTGDPTVSTTDPTEAPQDTTLDVRVIGSNFDRGSRADLALDCEVECVLSEKVKTNSTRYVSSGELVANITIAADASVDLYDVRVTTSGGKRGIGIERFAVTEGHANPQTGYTKLVIDGLRGSSSCTGLAINDSRVIAGSCVLRKGGRHAFVWSSTTGVLDLGRGEVQELSDFNGPVAAGWTDDSVNRRPVVWELGTGTNPIDLPQGCGGNRIGINAFGDKVTGTACLVDPGSGQIVRLPAVWTRDAGGWSSPQTLPLPAGYTSGNGWDMSPAGVILGTVGPTSGTGNEWFAWFPPYLQAERIPLGSHTYVLTHGINDDGTVAGVNTTQGGNWRSLVWQRSGSTWDAALDIGRGSGYGINNFGTVVGDFGTDVYVWSPSTGRIELGREQARDVNEAGEIVGTDNGRAIVWLPPR